MFYERFKQEIISRRLIEKKETVLVGVSGGPDSLALLHAFGRLKGEWELNVVAGHVNHQLRGKESEEDAEFVKAFCRERNIPCEVARVDVRGHLAAHGGNKQAVARQLRYEAFYEMAQKWKAGTLALAHHADDQLETVLMRLIRGTGVSGLAGMEWKREWRGIRVIRPLLSQTKADIEAYCAKHHLHPRLDSSNQSSVYTRNRLRHELVPLLKSFNPKIEEAVLKLSDLIHEEEKLWKRLTEDALNKVVTQREKDICVLDVSSFLHLPVALQRRVVKLILSYLWNNETHEVTLDSVEQVRKLAGNSSPSAMVDLPGGVKAEREYGKLVLKVQTSTNERIRQTPLEMIPLSIPGMTSLPGLLGKIEILETDAPIHKMRSCRDVAVFDREKLDGPIYARSRKPGDKMSLLGMAGSKKVKSLLMEAKIPKRLRDLYPIVTAGDKIIWIPGVRRSGEAPVTPKTRRYLYLFWYLSNDRPNPYSEVRRTEMHQDIKEILITEEEIQKKVAELGKVISEEYKGMNPLCICVLKGAVPFMADLVRKIEIPIEMDFMAVSSYGNSTTSSGVVRILKDLDTSIEGRHVLIVEDIIDSGLTLSYLVDMLKGRNAASVKIVTLLDKPDRRKVKLSPDYSGFTIPDAFVVGYGLDYAEKYRNLPYIGILKEEVYMS